MTQETAHMPLDERGLEAAREQPGTNHDGIIRAYLQTAAADVSGLVERLRRAHLEYADGVPVGYGDPVNPDGPEAATTLHTLSASNAALEAENARLRACLAEAMYALIECEEYFDNRADADHDGIGFVANEEMKLQVMIRRVREGGKVE